MQVLSEPDRVFPCADPIELPISLLAALSECGVTIGDFIERIQRGSVWEDQAIRSADRRVVIQAFLKGSSLRCMIQVGSGAFYHTSTGVLRLFDVALPASVMAAGDLDASDIINDPLFQLPGIRVRRMVPMGGRYSAVGVTLFLSVPFIVVFPGKGS